MATELTFTDRLIEATRNKRSVLCVGFDPRLDLTPLHLRSWAVEHYGRTLEAVGRVFVQYNRAVMDAVAPYVEAVKAQIAFYEPYGQWGIWAYEETIKHARSRGLVFIADVKRGDGEDTAGSYARTYLGMVPFWGTNDTDLRNVGSPLQVDALTIQPYIGSACIQPFVARIKEHGRGAFVVTKTSYRPNSEVEQLTTQRGVPLWVAVALMVDEWGKGTEGIYGYRNLGVVMGATYPHDAVIMRNHLPKAYFLIPGYGDQGAPADDAVVGLNTDGLGGVVNSSRAIGYAYCHRDKRFQGPAEQSAELSAKAAEAGRDELNAALKRAGKLNW